MSNQTASQPNSKPKQPLRPRHVPQRTCVACKRTEAKRGLVRIVRTPEGRVVIDERGKMNGRGAYLCRTQSCWAIALKRGALERGLKLQINQEDRAMLAAYAASLPLSDDEEGSEGAPA